MRPFIAFIFFALAAPVAAQPGPVVISELMWSGSTASTADEWIELYNASNAAIDLVGWTLTYRSGGKDKVMFVLDAAVIPPDRPFSSPTTLPITKTPSSPSSLSALMPPFRCPIPSCSYGYTMATRKLGASSST